MDEASRLFLLTPVVMDRATFPALLSEALATGDIAAVLIGAGDGGSDGQALAAELVAIIQNAGAAALVAEDTRMAGRLNADGVHSSTGLGDLRAAVDSFGGKRTVGAGNIHSRHTAMEAAEIGADYIFFGRLHGDTHDAPHAKALDLAEWWSELTEVPAVIMAGRSLASVEQAAATGAAFVALNEAVWAHELGPGAAIRKAQELLLATRRRAA
jgi:thiamine-phosphate pyrophosphorylase